MHIECASSLPNKHLGAGMHLAHRPTTYRVRLSQEARQCI